MKNEEITVKIKKTAAVKIGITFGVIAALVLLFFSYSFFLDLNSVVADGMNREALTAIESELNRNGYLTALRCGTYEAYNSSGELLSSEDEYYSLCVSVAQRKSASDFLTEKYPEQIIGVDFNCYP